MLSSSYPHIMMMMIENQSDQSWAQFYVHIPKPNTFKSEFRTIGRSLVLENIGKYQEILGNIWKYCELLGNIGKYWEIWGKLENINKYWRISINIGKYQENWKILGNIWKFCKHLELSGKLGDIQMCQEMLVARGENDADVVLESWLMCHQ